jgi:hypothetical protein
VGSVAVQAFALVRAVDGGPWRTEPLSPVSQSSRRCGEERLQAAAGVVTGIRALSGWCWGVCGGQAEE